MEQGHVRNRMTSPSINFPQDRAEARRALWMQVTNYVNRPGDKISFNPLGKVYTTDTGLGQKRTQAAADWLEEARQDFIIMLNAALIEMREAI